MGMEHTLDRHQAAAATSRIRGTTRALPVRVPVADSSSRRADEVPAVGDILVRRVRRDFDGAYASRRLDAGNRILLGDLAAAADLQAGDRLDCRYRSGRLVLDLHPEGSMVVDKRGRIRFQSGLLHRAGIDRGDRVVVAAARGRVCVTSGNATSRLEISPKEISPDVSVSLVNGRKRISPDPQMPRRQRDSGGGRPRRVGRTPHRG